MKKGKNVTKTRKVKAKARPAADGHKPAAKRKSKLPAVHLKVLKKNLLLRREQLVHEMRRLTEEGKQAQRSEVMDAADQAVDAYESEVLYGLSDAERRSVEEVDQALKRIEEGQFGLCVICSKPISMERLKAMPSAKMCIACQSKQEAHR